MAKDLLLEIGTEELPPSFIQPALEQIKNLAETVFNQQRLDFKKIAVFGSPCRLALKADELAEKQKDLVEEILGPPAEKSFDKDGYPTPAGIGFAKSQKIKVGDLKVKQTPKGKYVCAQRIEQGKPVPEILPEILPQIIKKISFPKTMRWDSSGLHFARPIRWLVCLYGSRVVKFSLAGVRSNRYTYGLRNLAEKKFSIPDVANYLKLLKNHYVIVDLLERREAVKKQVESVARLKKAAIFSNEPLLDEVTNLVEYPTAVLGEFDKRYLNLPSDVLITCMRHHQKCFSLVDKEGKLLPYFVGVRNGISEYLERVKEGYERALTARLEDAEFFFKQDTKRKLAECGDQLKSIVFHEKLGTLDDKTQRIIQLSEFISTRLPITHSLLPVIKRIALLCKADLVTHLVGEFPELQGIAGGEYALRSGESKKVSQGIREHYLPLTRDGELPGSLEGTIVSIADKLDTIVGDFLVGLIPSGSEDPYGLRRQGYGIIRIIAEKNLALSLDKLVDEALHIFSSFVGENRRVLPTFVGENRRVVPTQEASRGGPLCPPDARQGILDFFRQRAEDLLERRGIRYDEIEAVMAIRPFELVDLVARAGAIHHLRELADFEPITVGFKRAKNILRQAVVAGLVPGKENVVAGFIPALFREDLLKEPEEKELWKKFQAVNKKMDNLVKKQKYPEALKILVTLRKPIDDFFDKVLVMSEDQQLCKNRLALLANIANLFFSIADFSCLVVQKTS